MNKVIVVTHKDYIMPQDTLYFPIFVGGGTPKHDYQRDNVGDNISEKNITYCELTAIYWAWKHLDDIADEYIGVSHYRRYFSIHRNPSAYEHVLTEEQLIQILRETTEGTVLVTPAKKYIQSIENHYVHSLKNHEQIHRDDINNLYKAVNAVSPDYNNELKQILQGHSAHMLNMFIMSKECFNEYCTWLFSVIDQVVDNSSNRPSQRRYAGALSEFLLDVWILHNGKQVKELQVFETERVSFVKKCVNAIKRRI